VKRTKTETAAEPAPLTQAETEAGWRGAAEPTAPPAYTLEATGFALVLEGDGAAEVIRRLHDGLDAGSAEAGEVVGLLVNANGGEVHGALRGLRLTLVRSPEVRTATLRIEGRG
jgi:hypothetical protein